MAEVVNLLAENLTQLLKENIQLISGLKDDVEKLLDDLGDFKAFLKEAGKVRHDNDILTRLIAKIRTVVNKAEDIIDKYVVATRSHYDNKWKRYLDIEHPGRKLELAKDIQMIRSSMERIRKEPAFDLDVLRYEALPNRGPRQIEIPIVEEEYVVGFDGEADAIIERLIDKMKQVQSRQADSCRRLSVQCDVLEFFSSYQAAEHVRSLLCFSSNKFELPAEKIPIIRHAFPLLRVLHTAPDESIIFTHFPRDMTKLFHLRYIAISTTLKILPKAINELRSMQTLIVRTTQNTLDIKGDIWQMTRLRHLQTNSSAQLPPPSSSKTKKDPFPNRNLQTLSRISPESCTAAALAKAPNLNNLGIQGNLAKLFETNKDTGSSLFKSLGELKLLEKLKLLNHGGKLQRLPQKYEFPLNIRKLTLSNTQLGWSELGVLGSLEYLEILKLVDNAFEGEEWEPSKGGFKRLQFLRIERTDLKSWKASNLHFPLLKTLILRQCLMLVEVPPSFAYIDSLQEMELNHTNPGAAHSALEIIKIKQEKEKEVKEKGGLHQRFKLNIYPPDERNQIKQTKHSNGGI
nr:putative late blight resistance protein homolog R1B-14 [Ipomoea batatas]